MKGWIHTFADALVRKSQFTRSTPGELYDLEHVLKNAELLGLSDNDLRKVRNYLTKNYNQDQLFLKVGNMYYVFHEED